MNFRGDVESPAAHILVCPGPLTPPEDYWRMIDAFFPFWWRRWKSKRIISTSTFWNFGTGVMMEKWSLLPSDMTMQINKE